LVATGSIIGSFYWLDSPGLLANKANHGCSFSYKVSGVPKLDSYDVSISLVSAHGITQGQLTYHDSWQNEGPYTPRHDMLDTCLHSAASAMAR
jgi:hypothetical protein